MVDRWAHSERCCWSRREYASPPPPPTSHSRRRRAAAAYECTRQHHVNDCWLGPRNGDTGKRVHSRLRGVCGYTGPLQRQGPRRCSCAGWTSCTHSSIGMPSTRCILPFNLIARPDDVADVASPSGLSARAAIGASCIFGPGRGIRLALNSKEGSSSLFACLDSPPYGHQPTCPVRCATLGTGMHVGATAATAPPRRPTAPVA